jgi:hypothetical protein
VKIAFFLRHALYLRNFESVVRELAGRGHDIALIFSPMPRQVDSTLLATLTAEYPNVTEQPIAPRTGWWWPVTDGARVFRDYLRYLEPEYSDASALVERGARRIPGGARWVMDNVPGMKSAPMRKGIKGVLDLTEQGVPPDPGAVAALRRWAPDLVLLTPMIDFTYGQADYVKAARLLGIPTVLAVASWDNLTNKGLVQVCPDRVLVWNAIQEEEAVRLHAIPRERIHKTGAQLYDHWFGMTPSLDRAAFCARVGNLDPAKPIILYLCSSAFICPDEVGFVKEWLTELRRSDDPFISEANVLVRPHPQHGTQWRHESLASFGNAVIWPPEGGAPLDEDRKRSYFDSLYHAGVAVGVNTSGFIEAGIVGRRTLTLATHHFRASQEGTLHFHYLTEGGLLEVARSFEEHLAQLARALNNPEETRQQVRDFIAKFVRPAGLDRPATEIVVQAIEEARTLKPRPWTTPASAPLLRALLWPAAVPVRSKVLGAINPGMHRGIERTKFPPFLPPERGSPKTYAKEIRSVEQEVHKKLASIADSGKPIVVGPWLGSVDDELLYWIPMLRWAKEAYSLDPGRLVVISRGGVESWYGELAHRYVDFFDLFGRDDFAAAKTQARQQRPDPEGLRKKLRLSDAEKRLLHAAEQKLGLGGYDLLHPHLMFSGLFYFHWSGRTSSDYLRHHARYLPLPKPEPGEIEMRLPEIYYAVDFPSHPSFADTGENRQFVRDLIERLLERSDVVLLDNHHLNGDAGDIRWKEAVTNGHLHDNRLVHAADWMTPRNALDIQSRIIANCRSYVGTYSGLSTIALFLRKPCIAFRHRPAEFGNGIDSTAVAVSGAFNTPFLVISPTDAMLLKEAL